MVAFNAWYYSFSPAIASYLNTHEFERTVMKGLLYPLIGILFLSSRLFSVTSAYPELAAVFSGLFAGSLVGAFYLGLPLSIVRARVRRLRGFETQRTLQRILSAVVIIGLAGVLLGEFMAYVPMLVFATSATVLASLFLAALITSSAVSKHLVRYLQRLH